MDEAARTSTFFPTFKGLPGKIQTAGGSVLLRDAGIIAFADTFDLETGEFVSRVLTRRTARTPRPTATSRARVTGARLTNAGGYVEK